LADELDWGDGDYARTAVTLEPVAAVVLDAAGVTAGDSVLDVACGTGNAALAAARRGARAVGVDAATGLIHLAGRRAPAVDGDVRFAVGDATDLPAADGSFDAVVSVFGVVFAPDAERAAAELLRAARPGGRIALSSWLPAGPITAIGRLLWSAVSAPPSDPPRWGDAAWASDLLARHGASEVVVVEQALAFTAGSPGAWFAEHEEHHPAWRWCRRQMAENRWVALRDESVALLAEANEDARAFRTTSRYLVITAVR
jgi:ubiquinone/menaquinone biosynthesis C-methylase UbiE